MTPQEIFNKAKEAAQAAAEAKNEKLGPEGQRGLDCGFALVVIKPARGPFVSHCKSIGVGRTRDYGEGGFEYHISKLHNIPTQSISVHYAAASAFAGVLVENGLNAWSESRLD